MTARFSYPIRSRAGRRRRGASGSWPSTCGSRLPAASVN
uniref:Uncharacterized protein n=1 Tax=Setaria italica TaxID=4555 RepID=K3ZGQ9_SETIT